MAACSEWLVDKYMLTVYSSIVSVLINVVNTILKMLLVGLILWIKEDEKSQQYRSIKIGVFIAQFINTGLALLLACANFTETNIPLLNTWVDGLYTDLHGDWYTDIGKTIVQTMLINAFMPPIEFLIGFSMKFVFNLMDRSYKKDSYLSKKKSISLYVDAYSGPQFSYHLRYASLLNTCFVTLMYGTALPLLYPIALITFVIFYVNEKLLIFYYYK